MLTNLRKSGIEVFGDIPWGTHFCQFYETKEGLLELLVLISKLAWKTMNSVFGSLLPL